MLSGRPDLLLGTSDIYLWLASCRQSSKENNFPWPIGKGSKWRSIAGDVKVYSLCTGPITEYANVEKG